ncbi:MAG: hypothetical protein ACFB8W_22585 [Elainellaceae cyanobacterium]
MEQSQSTKPRARKPWAGINQPRNESGHFQRKSAEPRGRAIALRLSQSLDAAVREAVGWQSSADNAVLRSWLEAAIAEKLQRDQNPNSSSPQ